jgi:hypothetical protein
LFLQISTLPPSELGPIVRYPRPKELTDDEEESPPSPKKRKASPMAEDAGAQKEPTVEEPTTAVRRGVRGSGGRMRGIGKRVISHHPSPALRGQLETVPESVATIKLPERK